MGAFFGIRLSSLPTGTGPNHESRSPTRCRRVGFHQSIHSPWCARRICPALRAKVFERFHKLEIKTWPFTKRPQRDKDSRRTKMAKPNAGGWSRNSSSSLNTLFGPM
jgi:hypothetical protein